MKNFKSGELIQRLKYQSFEPTLINRQWEMDNTSMLSALSKADRQIGRLDMFSEYVPDLNLFISMHITKEANKSSRIEGTQTEFEEALLPEEEVLLERRDDWHEVNNYIAAMNHAVEALGDLPFSNRLLQNSHSILMQGVRGEQKTPGEYRLSQNWIGGSRPDNAHFVPPMHEHVPELMGDLEKFIQQERLPMPELINVALLHYQFETIHPFLDGNGRMGRMLVSLYLMEKRILKHPILYISTFLESHRKNYYASLDKARESEAGVIQWISFFLDAVEQTAKDGVKVTQELLLYDTQIKNDVIPQLGRQAKNAMTTLEMLYIRPLVNAKQLQQSLGFSAQVSQNILRLLTEHGILKEITGNKRNRLFIFHHYITLLEGKHP